MISQTTNSRGGVNSTGVIVPAVRNPKVGKQFGPREALASSLKLRP